MFNNCKGCLFYDKWFDDFMRKHDDELDLDGNFTDKHFCECWDGDGEKVVPTDVWGGKTLCPYHADQ